MVALVELKFNSNAKRVHVTLIEGIEYSEINYIKPNARTANWVLKAKVIVSPDNLLTISAFLQGISLSKAAVIIKVEFIKGGKAIQKEIQVDDDYFSKRGGILIFSRDIDLNV